MVLDFDSEVRENWGREGGGGGLEGILNNFFAVKILFYNLFVHHYSKG